MADEFDKEEDPLNLESVDREIRIEKLKGEINEAAGGEVMFGGNSELDPKLEESFLESVKAVEEHGWHSPLDALKQEGFELPSAETLDDAALHTKLWELIHHLAGKRLFLSSTNHLSDRELYTFLIEEGLREELMGFGLPFGNCHLDPIGSGSDEDDDIYLRYYANDKIRERWANDFKNLVMPPKETPPFDRDKDLPQAEW